VIAPVGKCTQSDLSDPNRPTLGASVDTAPDTAREVNCAIIDNVATNFDPPAVPGDVAAAVGLFHARPEIWWAGPGAGGLGLAPRASSAARRPAG
jgi:hypothetical protein